MLRGRARAIAGVPAAVVAGLIVSLVPPVGASAASSPPIPLLRTEMRALVRSGVPGVLVRVQHNGNAVELAAGAARVSPMERARPGERFRIASVTKTFVATVVLQLVAEGKLALGDHVGRFLPGLIEDGGMVTVRELLNHTSGLPDFANVPAISSAFGQGGTKKSWTPRQLIALIRNGPRHTPGLAWSYSSTNYVILGLIVEKVTGRPLADVLRARIFSPLGLRATSFDSASQIAGPHLDGYVQVTGTGLRRVTGFLPSTAWAAGAAVSNAADVARFLQALLGGRLLAPAQLHEMRTTVSRGATDPGEGYGLGLMRSRTFGFPDQVPPTSCGFAWGHTGDVAGYMALAFSSGDGSRQVVIAINTEVRTPRGAMALSRLFDTAYCHS
ncbi:MAG: D-alanyl-D-alanine carboxypeptidase [Pseudonocardiales bacterium]|nr:D-alanyl-D-alanine carboxypeptidase [Pseudonocardiales bacterium]